MGQVTVTINGRSYKIGCGAGEEARLMHLAEILSLKVERLAMDFGQHGNERLLLMAALLTTDELLDARGRLAEGQRGLDDGRDAEEDILSEGARTAGPLSEPITLSAPEMPVVAQRTGVDTGPADNTPAASGETTSRPEPAPGAAPRSSLEVRLAMARSGKSTLAR